MITVFHIIQYKPAQALFTLNTIHRNDKHATVWRRRRRYTVAVQCWEGAYVKLYFDCTAIRPCALALVVLMSLSGNRFSSMWTLNALTATVKWILYYLDN